MSERPMKGSFRASRRSTLGSSNADTAGGSAPSLTVVWPVRGPDFNAWNCDAARLMAIVQANPGFWCADHQLKYLSLNVDTRSGHFRLKDRDGTEISPDRVVAAINRWRQWHPAAQLVPGEGADQ